MGAIRQDDVASAVTRVALDEDDFQRPARDFFREDRIQRGTHGGGLVVAWHDHGQRSVANRWEGRRTHCHLKRTSPCGAPLPAARAARLMNAGIIVSLLMK